MTDTEDRVVSLEMLPFTPKSNGRTKSKPETLSSSKMASCQLTSKLSDLSKVVVLLQEIGLDISVKTDIVQGCCVGNESAATERR